MNPSRRNAQISRPVYAYTLFSLQLLPRISCVSAADAENSARSERAVLREWLPGGPRKLHCDLGQNEGRKRMTHSLHSSVLILVIGIPKRHCLTPDSHKAMILMWHFIFHKVFPSSSSFIPLQSHSIITDKVSINYDRLDTYKGKLNQQ